jgi:hypothetical protein
MLTITVKNDSYFYNIVIPIYVRNATLWVARSVRTAFQPVHHAGQAEKKRFSCMMAEAVVLTNLIMVARFEALTKSSG